ncbi:hypothetical protein [Salinispira pacifica]|uniref:hypothetical protein n=1 Tax=Salinispira pacifica TaxID=1307761 RepID=UPI00059BA050|nr:hypothetical protein [Salinispira pacifica]
MHRMFFVFAIAALMPWFSVPIIIAEGQVESAPELLDDSVEQEVYSGTPGRITAYISGPAGMVERLEKEFESQHGDVVDVVLMGCGPSDNGCGPS